VNNDDVVRLEELRGLIEKKIATPRDFIDCAHLTDRARLSLTDETIEIGAGRKIVESGLRSLPESPELIHKLAIDIYYDDDREKGLRWLGRAKKLYEQLGRFSEAESVAHDLALFLDLEARQTWDAGDLEKCEKLFRSVILIHPLYASAWFHLGQLYDQQSKWIEAARCYWRGIQLGRGASPDTDEDEPFVEFPASEIAWVGTPYSGDDAEAPYLLGLCSLAYLYYQQKYFDQASELAYESLSVNPRDGRGMRVIAFSLYRSHDRSDKMQELSARYPGTNLPDEADKLERRCFRSKLAKSGRMHVVK
jgi:tetratricopeptide (TPR) repeat protein